MAGILRSLFGQQQQYSYDQGPWGQGMVRLGNAPTQPVTFNSAMTLSAVFACMRLLSEAIASMPLDTFVRDRGTRKPYRPKPDYLSFQPPEVSVIDYLSQVMLSLLSDGNAFVATPRDDMGIPLDLVPIDPCLVKIDRDARGVKTFYVGEGEYNSLDIMHIPAMLMPGALRGLSPLGYAMATIDLGLSAQNFGASFFRNGALPAGVIEAPGEFPEASAKRAAGLWDARHRGPGNSGKVGVLTGGAKFNKITINPDEAQFLEVRQFQVPDVARFFGVPPHLIADASNSTSWGSGLSEQNVAFGQFSLRPWVNRIETAHGRLLTTQGLPDVFVKLNMDALLRSDTEERYAAYALGIQNGWLTVNEVRALEDMAPITGGDEPFMGRSFTTQDVAAVLKEPGPVTAAVGG